MALQVAVFCQTFSFFFFSPNKNLHVIAILVCGGGELFLHTLLSWKQFSIALNKATVFFLCLESWRHLELADRISAKEFLCLAKKFRKQKIMFFSQVIKVLKYFVVWKLFIKLGLTKKVQK